MAKVMKECRKCNALTSHAVVDLTMNNWVAITQYVCDGCHDVTTYRKVVE